MLFPVSPCETKVREVDLSYRWHTIQDCRERLFIDPCNTFLPRVQLCHWSGAFRYTTAGGGASVLGRAWVLSLVAPLSYTVLVTSCGRRGRLAQKSDLESWL